MMAELTLDQAGCTAVVDALLAQLHEHYVFPEIVLRIEAELRDALKQGVYTELATLSAFCELLTSQVQAISHDKHLRVFYHQAPQPHPRRTPDDPRHQVYAALHNYGFYRVERLAGNIGYLDLRGFYPADIAGETAVAAMNVLASTSALIIDLRKNGGGSPAMIALLSTYLFPSRPLVHLNSLYWRRGERLDQFWTLPYVPGQRYIDKPVYVLTSNYTFSGAEEFTYNLQTRQRATIIGEVTSGGAHPGGIFRLNEYIDAFIPTGRAINPVTGTNWEGTGVSPDITVPSAQAFAVAHRLALKHALAELGQDPPDHLQEFVEEARQALAALEGEGLPDAADADGQAGPGANVEA